MNRRGWCPDVHAPMLSGDGWLARIKPHGARLSRPMAHAIADAATRWGSGVIELTARANLQIRGLREAKLVEFASAMIDCGAAEADPRLERRRNLIVSPLAGSDPGVHPATEAVAAAIVGCLPTLDLPAKYGFVVDGGGSRPLRGVTGDVVVRLATGSADMPPSVGYVPYGDAARGSMGLAPVFGQTNAAALRALADLAARHGDGALRIGPWRTFLIGGVPAQQADALARAADAIGLIADPADPRLRIAACPGGPACSSGLMPARADAALMAAVPGAVRVHVSGCAKGCAHPAPAALTFVGTADGYALVRHGRAGDAAVARGLSLADCLQTLRAA
jgi:precorrin-3B synthase